MPPYGLSTQKTADVFSTDPIRCLRSVRFAAGFGLSVDPAVTKKEIMRHAHRCKFDAPGEGGCLSLLEVRVVLAVNRSHCGKG